MNGLWLIQSLEDLQVELRQWSVAATDAVEAAAYDRRQVDELVERTSRRASMADSQVQDLREEGSDITVACEEFVERGQRSRQEAERARRRAGGVLDKATRTQSFWEGQLEKALAWLARAERRLEQAQRRLDTAEQRLSDAERSLSAAEDSLDRCRSSDKPRDCSKAEARVSAAESRVERAREFVAEAERHVAEATEEVERAQSRVDCCREAVQAAEEAVSQASTGIARADQAIATSGREIEFAETAVRLAAEARTHFDELKASVERLNLAARDAVKQAGEALILQQGAEQIDTGAQRDVLEASYDLTDRVAALRRLFGSGTSVLAVAPPTIPDSRHTAERESIVFASAELQESHYLKHHAEFGTISRAQYVERAVRLRDAAPTTEVLCVRRPNGDSAKFDRQSGEFGVFTTAGEVRTFFRPIAGIRYFNRQANLYG
jgi:chromosome segregation ATPase